MRNVQISDKTTIVYGVNQIHHFWHRNWHHAVISGDVTSDYVANGRHFISSFMVTSYQHSFVTAAIFLGVDTKVNKQVTLAPKL